MLCQRNSKREGPEMGINLECNFKKQKEDEAGRGVEGEVKSDRVILERVAGATSF